MHPGTWCAGEYASWSSCRRLPQETSAAVEHGVRQQSRGPPGMVPDAAWLAGAGHQQPPPSRSRRSTRASMSPGSTRLPPLFLKPKALSLSSRRVGAIQRELQRQRDASSSKVLDQVYHKPGLTIKRYLLDILIGNCCGQIAHGALKRGVKQIGGNFGQGNQHKPTFGHAWVGNGQIGGSKNLIPIK